MSDETTTPETDAEEFETDTGHSVVTAEFARNLERQRDQARRERDRLRLALQKCVDSSVKTGNGVTPGMCLAWTEARKALASDGEVKS